MTEAKVSDRTLAEAAAKFVDALHHIYPGIKIRPVSRFEDEDFAFEVTIPTELSIDDVMESCHKECIRAEDEYDLFIYPHVTYARSDC